MAVCVSLICQTLVATETVTSSDLTHLSMSKNKLTLEEMRKYLQLGKFSKVSVNLCVVVINVLPALTNYGMLPVRASPKSTVFRVGFNWS